MKIEENGNAIILRRNKKNRESSFERKNDIFFWYNTNTDGERSVKRKPIVERSSSLSYRVECRTPLNGSDATKPVSACQW
jgi:hypothetical protein